jgi:hypothetical protein
MRENTKINALGYEVMKNNNSITWAHFVNREVENLKRML